MGFLDPKPPTRSENDARYATPAKTAGKAKDVHGGAFLSPVRVPTLTVERSWPDRNVDYRILWTENAGQTLYAIGFDSSLRKSTDGGRTWTKRGYYAFGLGGGAGSFLKLSTGTLLAQRPGTPTIIVRSTEDGATGTAPFTGRSAHYAMAVQSWAQDKVTGYIYYGEYQTTDTMSDLHVYRSTDDGATWSIFHTFPGYASTSPDKVRHVHSVQWDHVSQRVVVMTGDSDPAAGLYQVNAGGTALEPLLLNRQITNIPGLTEGARAIAIIPFPDYLCWTGDSTGNPYLMRVARSELSKANPIVERVYRLNTSGWFACRASDNGSRWVVMASQESQATRLDTSMHVYAVEDQGATVFEVAAIPTDSTNLATLAPVGSPEIHGDVFFLQSHNAGSRLPTWRLRLAQGFAKLEWPQERPTVYAWQTLNSGSLTVPASSSTVYAHAKVPGLLPTLHIFDAGVTGQSGEVTGLRVDVRKKGAAYTYRAANISERYSARLEAGGPIASFTFAAGDDLEFVVLNNSAVGPVTGTAFYTFGFGA